jgi:hypothetical protein
MVHEVEGVFEAWQEGAPTADVAGTRPPAPPRPALPLVPEIPQWLIDEAAERRDAEKEQQERQRLALTALSGNDGAGAGNDGAVSGNDGAGDDDDGDDGGGSSGRDRPASGRKRRRPPNRDVAAIAAAAIAAADEANAASPDTYTSAQDDETYLAELFDPYQEKAAAADEKIAAGERYNGLSDQLTLYTVLMALSLFLLGVAAVLKKFRMQILIVGVSMVIFTFAAVLTALVPFVALG